jgi:succinate dehydrogenase hydrophobic anchor subunit
MDWMQIASALALVMFLIILFPTALKMMKNSPKATSSDWKAVIVPLIIIILFIMLLIRLV